MHFSTLRARTRNKEDNRVVAMANHNNHSNSVTSVHQQQQLQYVALEPPRRWHIRVMQKLERWLFLYNVATGLYTLDWWERCVFNTLFFIFFVVAGYNSSYYLQRIGVRFFAWAWYGDSEGVAR
ncbi:hypothetical protein M758_2G113900 [Ceratodon purpureus]|nr:hypothetical protein M758_2G113900 [Ceratodon purpureus]